MARDSSPKAKRKKRRVRDLPGRIIARFPWLRRRYVRRVLRTIEKYREKGKRLPEDLGRIDRQLRSVPPPKRAEVLEQMFEAGVDAGAALSGRAMRRAADRQERRRGKGGGNRPGLYPGQRRR